MVAGSPNRWCTPWRNAPGRAIQAKVCQIAGERGPGGKSMPGSYARVRARVSAAARPRAGLCATGDPLSTLQKPQRQASVQTSNARGNRASRAAIAFAIWTAADRTIPLATSGSRGRLTWHERFAAKQKRRPLFLRECVGLMGRARAAPACGGRAEVVSRVRCAAVRSPTPCDAEPPRLHLAAGHLRRPPHERGRGPRPAGLPGRPFPAGRERGRCSSVRSAGGTPRRKTAHPGPSPAGESTDPRY